MKILNSIVLIILFSIPSYCFSKDCNPEYLESEIYKEISLYREQTKDIILSNLKIGNFQEGRHIIILTSYNIKYLKENLELDTAVLHYYNKNSCEWIRSDGSDMKPISF